MQRYYSTLDLVNNSYVGTVYESSSNVVAFKTAPHTSQVKAMDEINSFLDRSRNTNTQNLKPQTVVNTVHRQVPANTGRPCCGKR